jgi:hypothetical protein
VSSTVVVVLPVTAWHGRLAVLVLVCFCGGALVRLFVGVALVVTVVVADVFADIFPDALAAVVTGDGGRRAVVCRSRHVVVGSARGR